MGILTFYSENKGVAEYELVATRSIAARADAPLTLEQIEAYTAQDESPWPRFSSEFARAAGADSPRADLADSLHPPSPQKAHQGAEDQAD